MIAWKDKKPCLKVSYADNGKQIMELTLHWGEKVSGRINTPFCKQLTEYPKEWHGPLTLVKQRCLTWWEELYGEMRDALKKEFFNLRETLLQERMNVMGADLGHFLVHFRDMGFTIDEREAHITRCCYGYSWALVESWNEFAKRKGVKL